MAEVVKKGINSEIVVDYKPQEFPGLVTESAKTFVSSQDGETSDFKISDLVADMVGISDLRKKSIEERIEKEALERLKQVEEMAYAEAYQLGKIEGAQDALEERRRELQERISHFDSILKEAEVLKQKMFESNEGSLIELAYKVAEKLAYSEIERHPETILKVISNVVNDVQNDEKIVIKVSSKDFDFIESVRESGESEAHDTLKKIKVEHESSIDPGGCLLETNFGSIDASLGQRLEAAWKLLMSKAPGRGDEENE